MWAAADAREGKSALSNSLLGVRVVVGTDPLTASSSLPRSLLPSLLQLVANQKNCTAQGPESQVPLALKVQLVQPRWSDWFYWQDWLSQGCTLFLSATKSIFFSHNESSEHIRLLAHELLALPGMQPASLKAFLEKYFKTQLGPVFLHHQILWFLGLETNNPGCPKAQIRAFIPKRDLSL